MKSVEKQKMMVVICNLEDGIECWSDQKGVVYHRRKEFFQFTCKICKYFYFVYFQIFVKNITAKLGSYQVPSLK